MLLLSKFCAKRAGVSRLAWQRARAFSRREDGGMIVFTLYILICMLLAVGMAIDTVRTEYNRILLQNTMDGAILAAAALEQELAPEDVVYDHLSRIGVGSDDITISVNQQVNEKVVASVSNLKVPTMFMNMVGIDDLPAPAGGTAEESVTDLEIAMVLDNSGSMGNNNDFRLNLLKPAAKTFIETVLDADTDEKSIVISIVPFATQVAIGSDLMSYYTGVSSEHEDSHCVTFASTDFSSTALPTATSLERTAHFDPTSSHVPARTNRRVCSTLASRVVTPWSNNETALKAKIDAMDTQNGGGAYTSIELGTKWGSILLDPSSRSVLTGMANDGLVDDEFRGQPFDYTRSATQKFLVVMSDGANTNQWDIKDPYREGASKIFMRSSDSSYAFYDKDRPAGEQFYRYSEGIWADSPHATDADSFEQLTWQELWEKVGVKKYTHDLAVDALGGSSSTYYNQVVMSVGSGTKNARTSAICKAARDEGVIIYTIGMDTYGQGDATLEDCASSPSHFYDVQAVDISDAFESIARSITQLRLTE